MKILDIIDKTTLVELCKPNNEVAVQHLIYRIVGEFLIFVIAVFLFENYFILSLVLFYMCAVWHGFWGYAGIGHEFYHGRVFSNFTINRLLYRLASYLTWNNPEFFRLSHNYHHRNTFATDDGEAFSTQDWRPLAIFFYIGVDIPLVFRRLFYAIINSAGFTISQKKINRIGVRFQVESILMLTFHFFTHLAIYNIFLNFDFNIIWFLLPFTGQFLNRLLAQSQHIGLASLKKEGALKHSRTLLLPRLLEFLYAGMNFHVEHHLMPAIPYYKLPKLNALLVERNLLVCADTKTFLSVDIWKLIQEQSRIIKK